jgi:hypothetical protein
MSKIEVNTVEPQCGTTLTLGGSGDTVQLGSGASQSGFGRTGTVDWDTTPKTATFSAVSGDGFFCNTTSGAFTCNLPAGSAGAIVSLADYAGTWQTNNLTVSPNGSEKIGGVNADVTLTTEGQSVTFVYVDSTQGWVNVQDSTSNERGNAFITATGGTITTCGNDKIHTFTGPGTFTVVQAAACAANNVMSHLVVAGGGGGSTFGGGGAGGFREVKSPVTPYTASPLDGYPSSPNRVTVTAQAYPITVGGGGAGGPGNPGGASNGNPSIFSTVTSTAGGGGNQDVPTNTSNPGGSGGGNQGSPAGSGNTPPVSPPQGNNGGTGIGGTGCSAGGGGGGATAVGTNASPGSQGSSGNGGAGATTNITGSPVAYAGGGGGGGDARAPGVTGGGGGTGGGGNGSGGGTTPGGVAGTANTGGGGGGAGFSLSTSPNYAVGATGGSGIVVIRYKFQ